MDSADQKERMKDLFEAATTALCAALSASGCRTHVVVAVIETRQDGGTFRIGTSLEGDVRDEIVGFLRPLMCRAVGCDDAVLH